MREELTPVPLLSHRIFLLLWYHISYSGQHMMGLGARDAPATAGIPWRISPMQELTTESQRSGQTGIRFPTSQASAFLFFKMEKLVWNAKNLQGSSSSAQTYWAYCRNLIILFTECPSPTHGLWYSLGYIYYMKASPNPRFSNLKWSQGCHISHLNGVSVIQKLSVLSKEQDVN